MNCGCGLGCSSFSLSPGCWQCFHNLLQSLGFSCPGCCRVLLNIMYLIVETVRQEAEGDKPEWKSMRQTFRAELGEEQEPGQSCQGWRQ